MTQSAQPLTVEIDDPGPATVTLITSESDNTLSLYRMKWLRGDFDKLPVQAPRARAGAAESRTITQLETRWSGFEKTLSLYARGMHMTRDLGLLSRQLKQPTQKDSRDKLAEQKNAL